MVWHAACFTATVAWPVAALALAIQPGLTMFRRAARFSRDEHGPGDIGIVKIAIDDEDVGRGKIAKQPRQAF